MCGHLGKCAHACTRACASPRLLLVIILHHSCTCLLRQGHSIKPRDCCQASFRWVKWSIVALDSVLRARLCQTLTHSEVWRQGGWMSTHDPRLPPEGLNWDHATSCMAFNLHRAPSPNQEMKWRNKAISIFFYNYHAKTTHPLWEGGQTKFSNVALTSWAVGSWEFFLPCHA